MDVSTADIGACYSVTEGRRSFQPHQQLEVGAMAIRTTQHAINKAKEIAQDKNIDQNLKPDLINQVMTLAATKVTTTRTRPTYERFIYRIIVIALGLTAVLVVVLAFVLTQNGKTVEAAFYTIGSASIGVLGGALMPSHGDLGGNPRRPQLELPEPNPNLPNPNPPGIPANRAPKPEPAQR
jgi:hypothetical protein